MRWRSTIVYLTVLLIVGTYYYYFEVTRKTQQETAAKEAKKVFHFQPDQVEALSISSKDKAQVELTKDEQWRIIQPVQAESDDFSIKDLLSALSRLEKEREITDAAQDLKPFGLESPSLVVRFSINKQWQELQVGEKNPVGDGYYARKGDGSAVFLIAAGNWSVLNKGLDDLRRRNLFTFQLEDATGLKVSWHDGSSFTVERKEDQTWSVPAQPEIRIKKSKVDNIVEQIHWLRAQSFLANDPKDMAPYGLDAPLVEIEINLKNGAKAELRLANPQKDEKRLTALSSQLPAVVQVTASVLDEIPRSADALVDRSLLGFKTDQITRLAWRYGEGRGQVEKQKDEQWSSRAVSDDKVEPLKEPWRVRSLLWELGDVEFKTELNPIPPVPSEPASRIELGNSEGVLQALSWERVPQDSAEPVSVWMEKDGKTVAVLVDAEKMRRVEDCLDRLSNPEKEKDKK